MYYKKEIGNCGEEAAFYYLVNNGFSIINRNFSCKLGEIDLIGLDATKYGQDLVFVEVKARTDNRCGNPSEAVTYYKMKHIIKAAEYYLMINHLENMNCRFDVIEVTPCKDGAYKINHIKNAFDYSEVFH